MRHSSDIFDTAGRPFHQIYISLGYGIGVLTNVDRVLSHRAELVRNINNQTEESLTIGVARLQNALSRSWEGEPQGKPWRYPARTEPRPPGITKSRLETPGWE
jgi:hypothetical protein